jgi:hypothetical protein
MTNSPYAFSKFFAEYFEATASRPDWPNSAQRRRSEANLWMVRTIARLLATHLPPGSSGIQPAFMAIQGLASRIASKRVIG